MRNASTKSHQNPSAIFGESQLTDCRQMDKQTDRQTNKRDTKQENI